MLVRRSNQQSYEATDVEIIALLCFIPAVQCMSLFISYIISSIKLIIMGLISLWNGGLLLAENSSLEAGQ